MGGAAFRSHEDVGSNSTLRVEKYIYIYTFYNATAYIALKMTKGCA